jgi:hypothetical protein
MDSSAPRLSGSYALSLTTIASKPAPTWDRAHVENEVISKPVKVPKKKGDLQVARFLYSKLSIQQIKVFAQCSGLGNPCTGKEP